MAERTLNPHYPGFGHEEVQREQDWAAGYAACEHDMARRAIDLESALRTITDERRVDGERIGEAETSLLLAKGRIAEFETQLAEREGLERELDAWLRGGDDSEDRHMLREIGTGFEQVSLCWEKEDGDASLVAGMVARVSGYHTGEGPDYWQALRAALDAVEAEKGKT